MPLECFRVQRITYSRSSCRNLSSIFPPTKSLDPGPAYIPGGVWGGETMNPRGAPGALAGMWAF
jgi:hypothetical protein